MTKNGRKCDLAEMQGIPMCTLDDLARKAGAETQMGIQHVRPGRKRVHIAPGDARDR